MPAIVNTPAVRWLKGFWCLGGVLSVVLPLEVDQLAAEPWSSSSRRARGVR